MTPIARFASTAALTAACALFAAPPLLAQGDAGLALDVVRPPAGRLVGSGSADLRSEPGAGRTLVRLGEGDHRFTILGEEGDWIRVRLHDSYGSEGWLPRARVREVESPRPAGSGGAAPPADDAPAGAKIDLAAQVERYLALLQDRERFRAGNATAVLSRAYTEVLGVDPAQIDYAAIDRDPEALARRLFAVMLALDERMVEFDRAGRMDEAMTAAKRRVLRSVRYLREQVLLRSRPEQRYRPGGRLDRPALAARPPIVHGLERYHWTVNPDYADWAPRHGSAPRTFFMMNVGTTVVSAAIARSAAEDNMFSHFSVGYVADAPQTVDGTTYPAGTVFTIEALIEAGVVIRPIEEHFESSVREVILFVRDPAKQAAVDRAADAFFAKARDAINAGEPLGYDFTMGHQRGVADALTGGGDDEGAPRLMDLTGYFCSGVGEAIGAGGGIEIFNHRSRLEQGPNTRGLFESWGVDPSRPVPAPGDGDTSTTLVRVAEGIDLAGVEDAHVGQAVLGEMFRWMDEDDYALRMPGWAALGARIAGGLNDGVFDMGLVPGGMTTDVMSSFVPLYKAGGIYTERLEAENAAFREAHGRPMTPVELARRLNEVRAEVDADRWFVRGPGGTYTLRPTWYAFGFKPPTRLTIERVRGDTYRVRRVTFDREGQVTSRASGVGVRDGEDLGVRFDERAGDVPARITYEFEHDGTVSGSWREDGDYRVERGR